MIKHNQLYERFSCNWSAHSTRIILTPSNTAKHTFLYLQEAGYFETVSPYFTERENLESYLILYTLSGNGILSYEENDYTLTAGSCFYIDCKKLHHYNTKPNCAWNFLWFHFYGNHAPGYYKLFAQNASPVLALSPDIGLHISDSIRKLINLQTPKVSTSELFSANIITTIITELIANHRIDTFDSGTMPSIHVPEYIAALAKYLDQHFIAPLTLDEMAHKYHRDKYQLLKDFKKSIGVTPNEYHIILRISYAKELLKFSNLSISEVANEIGIINVTHFINLFKDREGTTPLVYRRKWSG